MGVIDSNTVIRFISFIDNLGDDCWTWNGHTTRDGYGTFKLDRKSQLAHRVAWRIFKSVDVPNEIDHLCRTRNCVKPDHLDDVTHATNMARGDHHSMGWKRHNTHCPQGHGYTKENTYTSSGYRRCKTCQRKQSMDRHNRLKDNSEYLERKRSSAREYMRGVRSNAS